MATTRKPVKKKAAKKKKMSQRDIQSISPNAKIVINKPAPIEVRAVSDQSLSLANPQQIMAFSKVLRKYITENKLSIVISGNDYAMVDGWKFAGANFGLTSIPEEPKAMHLPGQYITILYREGEFTKKDNQGKVISYIKEFPFFSGFSTDVDAITNAKKEVTKVTREVNKPYFSYQCRTKIIRLSDGVEVGAGFALCTNLETKKIEFDEYSVQSMSQTRSIGKGYRNLLGYVMKAAGIEGTPAEEMPDDESPEPKAPKNKSWRKEGPKKGKMSDGQKQKVLDRIKAGDDIMDQTLTAFDLDDDPDFKDAMKVLTNDFINK